jgi:acyl-CoA thioester hydrolase
MPHVTEIGIRFRDIDAMKHVNNAVYATYLEQARAEYARDVLDLDLDDIDTVLATLSSDYSAPLELSDSPVEVRLTVPELGASSIPMEYELRGNGGSGPLAATAETVQVAFDRETGDSRPIPDAWRDRIAAYHGL